MKLSLYRIVWLFIIAIALFLRLYGLDLNPIGLSHDDELHELINAKSIALTGSHAPGRIYGIFSPNESCPGNCVYGELGSYILIPWMVVFSLDMVWSKIPFVVASVFLVFLTGKLFENLSNNKKIGLIVGLFVAINPWAIHFGRTAYFTNFSYTFYILAAYFFTRNKSYKSNLILGTLFSLVASLFYFGTKPIMPLIVAWGIIYNLYKFKLHNLKFTFALVVIIVLVIGGYLVLLSNSYAGRRFKELDVSGAYDVKALVDQQRRVSLEIPLVRDFAINKYTVEIGIRTEKYLSFFSPTFLFLRSEGSTDIYYISNHSYNYLIDLPFLIFGIAAIFSRFSIGLFGLSLLLLSIIPAALKISGDTIYPLRAGLAYPLLTGFVGWGCYFCYSKLLNLQRYRRLFIIFTVTIYTISLVYFLIMYWYRTPIDKSEGWYFHKRVVANYIKRIQEKFDKKIIVVTSQPDATFNTYVFFSGVYNNQKKALEINKAFSSRSYQYRGASFVNSCDNITDEDIKSSIIFVERGVKCSINLQKTDKIANPRDSGGLYSIINEFLCANYPKSRYPYPRVIFDFKVEDLNKEKFCQLWITNPDQ